MLENIRNGENTIATIIRSNFKKEGISFFTEDDSPQQLGYMNRPEGYIIQPHRHNRVQREINRTQEVLFIKSGEIRIDFYNDDHDYLESKILLPGDVVLLVSGGHGFEMIQTSEIIEVKQGPYLGDKDKVHFDAVDTEKIKL